jgi:hypothetical protein
VAALMSDLKWYLPEHLVLPGSTLRRELQDVLQRHVVDTPEPISSYSEEKWKIYTDPERVFFDCRMHQTNNLGFWSYHLGTHELERLDMFGRGYRAEGIIRGGGRAGHKITEPNLYQLIMDGARAGLEECSVECQGRTTNTFIHYDTGRPDPVTAGYREPINPEVSSDVDEVHVDFHARHEDWSTPLRLALETDNEESLAAHKMSSWYPYYHYLSTGELPLPEIAESHQGLDGKTRATVQLPLSALIFMFTQGCHPITDKFPDVDSDGIWTLPRIAGNKGVDLHVMYGATKEILVTVA